MRHGAWGLVCAVLLVSPVVFCDPTLAGVSYRTAALTGDRAPGTVDGVTFTYISNSVINDLGEVAFIGRVTGPEVDVSNHVGVWSSGGGGSLELVARKNMQAPGASPGQVLSQFLDVVLGEAGEVLIEANLNGPGVHYPTNHSGLWIAKQGNLSLVSRGGDQVPGADDGVRYTGPGTYMINALGQVAINSGFTGSSTRNVGILAGQPDQLALVVRKGDAVPGGSGDLYGNLRLRDITDSGTVVYTYTDYTYDPGSSVKLEHLFITDLVDAPVRIVGTGDAAPGTEPGVYFGRDSATGSVVRSVGYSDSGQVIFHSKLAGAGVDDTNDEGVWWGPAAGLSLLIREGDHAPGTPAGTVFGLSDAQYVFDYPFLGASGEIAIRGYLRGAGVSVGNDVGYWVTAGGELRLVAREADPAPGLGPGVWMAPILSDSSAHPMVNPIGQIAFICNVRGAGVTAENDRALWATDPSGELTLVAREGTLFDVNDDPVIEDLRMIERINFADQPGGTDGGSKVFNASGKLLFELDFTDGSSGAFIALVPEPATAGVVVLALGLVLCERRLG